MDYTKLTLGELIINQNTTVKRCAWSIIKTLQKQHGAIPVRILDVQCGHCGYQGMQPETNRKCTECGSQALIWTPKDEE